MISALLSFLGGSAFRMIWGEVSAYFSKRQDHAQEMDRMRLQSDLEKERHARDCERLRLQSELGVKEVEVQRDADLARIEGDAWRELVAGTARQTGIKILDIWNGVIRPMLATLAIAVVVAEIAKNGFTLNDWDRELVAAILGIYLADRSLSKRGK
jgi:hypothetical protein